MGVRRDCRLRSKRCRRPTVAGTPLSSRHSDGLQKKLETHSLIEIRWSRGSSRREIWRFWKSSARPPHTLCCRPARQV